MRLHVLALALTLSLNAAPYDLDGTRLRGNNIGLGVLGVWAAASITTGAVGWATTFDSHWQGVHQASLAWGAINLGLAAVGLGMGLSANAAKSEPADALAEAQGLTKLYAINAALDVAYLAIAALVWQNVKEPRVQGFTEGSMVQALWLLVFDSTMALFHHFNSERAL